MIRSYSSQAPNKRNTVAFLNCPIDKCNRKYKQENKLIQHVERAHYHMTRCGNYLRFTLLQRERILQSAAKYVKILDATKDLSDEDIQAMIESDRDNEIIQSAIKLLPQNKDKEITESELSRISLAQRDFAKRIFRTTFFSELDKTDTLIDDLQHFFQLGLPYYDTNFCPTIPIDFYWHAMMQDAEFYVEICESSVKSVIPHCVNREGPDIDIKRHEYFCDLFQHKYGRIPTLVGILNEYAPIDIESVVAEYLKKGQEYSDIHHQKEEEKRLAVLAERRRSEEERRRFQIWLVENNFGPADNNSTTYDRRAAFRAGLSGDAARKHIKDSIARSFVSYRLHSSC